MPELNDCYVLAPKRSAELALSFLNHFLPRREPCFAPEDPPRSWAWRRTRVSRMLYTTLRRTPRRGTPCTSGH